MSENKKMLLEVELEVEQKAKEQSFTTPDASVQEVQKLLDYQGQRAVNMLRTLGLANHIKIAENLKGQQMDLEKANQEFKGQVFHVDAIKTLAINYRLRLLKTCHYKGSIDVEIPAKIEAFAKEVGLELTEYHLHDKFYILGPDEAFDRKEVVIPVVAKDPLLFYKIDDQHYRLVHRWGADFTPFRALMGWKWKSESNHFFFGFLLAAVVAFLGLSLVCPPTFIGSWGFWAIGTVLSLIFGMIHHQSNVKNDKFIEENLTENCWNNNNVWR